MIDAFDYVVVGGGSAGCVAAAQLADDPSVSVLLLEAGPSAETHPETLHADGYKEAFVNDAVIGERFSTPQSACGQQRIFMGSGTVMGGSGSVNGMVYTRGDARDFASWPRGWQWSDVVPDFEAIEAVLRPRRRPPTRFTEACISAARTCGFELRDDLNDGDLGNAIGYEWMSYEGDRRRSSYVSFIKDRPARPNLHIVPQAHVHRIVFDEAMRAVAVEYDVDGTPRRAQVNHEVIMAAGALETPKLLMLSGLGPSQALRAVGIPVVLERPSIGQNLHDHPNVPLFFWARHHVDCLYPQLYSFFRTHPDDETLATGQSDTCYVYWPAPSAMKQVLQRMLPTKLPASLYGNYTKALVRGSIGAAFGAPPVRGLVNHLYAIVVILGKPHSRGSVRLASPDPRVQATLDPAYFSDPHDMQTMIKGVRKARALSRSGALAGWRSAELMPGRWTNSETGLTRFIANNAITTYHFAGTCRMGDDRDAVCDSRLRLHGVTGVRIADASAIPVAPVSALNAPSMLVGYRAARYATEERRDQVHAAG